MAVAADAAPPKRSGYAAQVLTEAGAVLAPLLQKIFESPAQGEEHAGSAGLMLAVITRHCALSADGCFPEQLVELAVLGAHRSLCQFAVSEARDPSEAVLLFHVMVSFGNSDSRTLPLRAPDLLGATA